MIIVREPRRLGVDKKRLLPSASCNAGLRRRRRVEAENAVGVSAAVIADNLMIFITTRGSKRSVDEVGDAGCRGGDVEVIGAESLALLRQKVACVVEEGLECRF